MGSSGSPALSVMPSSVARSPAPPDGLAPPTSSATWLTRSRMILAWGAAKRAVTPPWVARNPATSASAWSVSSPRTDAGRSSASPGRCAARSRVVTHRGPQAVAVQGLGVALHRLAGAGRNHRLALVMDVHHELLRFRRRVAEYRLEHVRHVIHEVDRVIPDDGDPGQVGDGLLPGLGFVYLRSEEHTS